MHVGHGQLVYGEVVLGGDRLVLVNLLVDSGAIVTALKAAPHVQSVVGILRKGGVQYASATSSESNRRVLLIGDDSSSNINTKRKYEVVSSRFSPCVRRIRVLPTCWLCLVREKSESATYRSDPSSAHTNDLERSLSRIDGMRRPVSRTKSA